ncbi:MAG: serine hydrolase domain-containing protein [Bacteroidales bacterium]|jgi:CubicO group peptidase (beta-lactamase class C family)
MRKIGFTVLALFVFWQVAPAQEVPAQAVSALAANFDKARLDAYFDALEAADRFRGSVALSLNGEVIYSRSVGNSAKCSKYRIGSISKTFTTVLVMKAFEQGKLTADQTIDAFFPSVPNAGKITIRHLLSHRSGIHNFTDDPDYLTWNTEPRAESQMVALIAERGSDFEPGSGVRYSNSNFVLLTYILEKTFEAPYAELLQKHITGPLGLSNTYMGGLIDSSQNECPSYRYLGEWTLMTQTDPSIPMGAGSVVSDPEDLNAFAHALFSGRLVNPESLEMMKTIQDGFGMGLFITPFYERKGYGHTGGIDGFGAVFTYFPDDSLAYSLTSNAANFNKNDISIAVLSAVYGMPYEIPEFIVYQVDPADLDQYTGTYSSYEVPLKITISRVNNSLIAQATDQSAFPLEPFDKDKFQYSVEGVILEFDPAEKAMTLKQRGAELEFFKD